MRSIAPPWVWGSLLVVGLVSIGTSLDASHDTGKTNDKLKMQQEQLVENQKCLLGYMAESSRVTKLRAAAAGERDLSIDDVLAGIDTVLKGVSELTLAPGDPAKARQEYRDLLSVYKVESQDYRKASAKLKRERAANPLPDLPATCADLPGAEK